MEPDTERFETIIQKLRDSGHKITPQRMAIVRIVATSKDHPSVENIYDLIKKDYPTVSLATVYKNILLLKSIGEVAELAFPDGSNRYDGRKPTPHLHVICVRCKKIVDVDMDDLDKMTTKIALDTNFKILNQKLEFFGICSECRNDKV